MARSIQEDQAKLLSVLDGDLHNKKHSWGIWILPLRSRSFFEVPRHERYVVTSANKKSGFLNGGRPLRRSVRSGSARVMRACVYSTTNENRSLLPSAYSMRTKCTPVLVMPMCMRSTFCTRCSATNAPRTSKTSTCTGKRSIEPN